MIHFTKGNILEASTEALVNSVNLQGVMGKGVALAFKIAFPNNFKEYVNACKDGRIKIGKIFVTRTDKVIPHYIINFPTKDHWRNPSKLEYIEDGLSDLVRWLLQEKVQSIAIPPLGSGLGKLDWQLVKSLILRHLEPLSSTIKILVYEPSAEFDHIIKLDAAPRTQRLTPARVMLLTLMKNYKALGNEINLLVVQKLSYFLQRVGEPLQLRFDKGWYGPYASNLIPVLKTLNGNFIQYRANSIKPETIINLRSDRFDEIESFFNNDLSSEQRDRVHLVMNLTEGFESPFGLEVLASVDYIWKNERLTTSDEILANIHAWTKRKKELIKRYHIDVALSRLKEFEPGYTHTDVREC